MKKLLIVAALTSAFATGANAYCSNLDPPEFYRECVQRELDRTKRELEDQRYQMDLMRAEQQRLQAESDEAQLRRLFQQR
jgi:hypothetical protein